MLADRPIPPGEFEEAYIAGSYAGGGARCNEDDVAETFGMLVRLPAGDAVSEEDGGVTPPGGC